MLQFVSGPWNRTAEPAGLIHGVGWSDPLHGNPGSSALVLVVALHFSGGTAPALPEDVKEPRSASRVSNTLGGQELHLERDQGNLASNIAGERRSRARLVTSRLLPTPSQ